VPDDLLRHVIGPTPYSSWWLWIAIVLLFVLIVWYAGVFVATMPEKRLHDLPVIGVARDKMLKRRFASTVREAGDRYRAGELEPAPAGAVISGALRGFLQQATGIRVQYMQVEDIASSEVASVAPLLEQLNDAQFNVASDVDVGQVSDDAEELIRSWT
jgi:hypothetical protein